MKFAENLNVNFIAGINHSSGIITGIEIYDSKIEVTANASAGGFLGFNNITLDETINLRLNGQSITSNANVFGTIKLNTELLYAINT